MPTHMKFLVRKDSLTEGSAKAAKAYKAKVASLTSEKADLQARIQSSTEDVGKLKSDLRHTSTAKARAEDKEKKAQEGLRVAEGETGYYLSKRRDSLNTKIKLNRMKKSRNHKHMTSHIREKPIK